MLDLKKRLEEMQESLGLSSADLRQRLDLVLLEDQSLASLKPYLAELDDLHGRFVRIFHDHLLQFPQPAKLLNSPVLLTRLKDQQLRYYQQMLRGPYDMQYARLRILVGLTHERVGVDQKWSLGGYHFYLNFMHRELRALWPDQPERVDGVFEVLMKVVFFDLTLAVDTYSAASKLEKAAFEEELAHATLHDPLTGLPNRQSMSQLVLQAMQRQAKPGARHAAVLFLDLDRFKLINDSLGHEVGDQVLIQATARIQRCLRPDDHLCRFGGDEFVVILNDMAEADDAESVAKRIIKSLTYPMTVKTHRLSVSASIGIAPLNGHDQEQDALREADLALYRAKAFGKSQLALYSDQLQVEVNQRLKIENALNEALIHKQFELYYQPIVDVENGEPRVIGVEALLRWWQDGVLIPPDAFIPILEESGQIVQVGEWVLRQACTQVRQWHENGHAGLRCSVNLSSRQLQSPDFAGRVALVLEETGFPATSLVLEITESLLMQDSPDTLATLRELGSLGIRIALDDFGTGFSSLGYLHRYPLHIIKVDKSFITKAPDDERLRAISRAIIGLGRGLSMDVIAEGIETLEQMDFLHAEGCHYVQGYWFSRPLSASLIEPVLANLAGTGGELTGAAFQGQLI